MDAVKLHEIGDRAIEAWNRQDVEAVVACYTDDLVYVDPNTRGPLEGADAMRRYLTKLFDHWQMHWTIREIFPLAEADGSAARWHAALTSRATGKTAEVEGMDLVVIEGDKIKRNEVYYDRVPLAAILDPGAAAAGAA